MATSSKTYYHRFRSTCEPQVQIPIELLTKLSKQTAVDASEITSTTRRICVVQADEETVEQ
jgi:hypothetical protein